MKKPELKMPLLKMQGITDIREFAEQQLLKIDEEWQEVIEALNQCNKQAVIDEMLDKITATWTYITHIYTPEEIKKGVQRHSNKLIQERKWETRGNIKIEMEGLD